MIMPNCSYTPAFFIPQFVSSAVNVILGIEIQYMNGYDKLFELYRSIYSNRTVSGIDLTALIEYIDLVLQVLRKQTEC